MRTILLAVEVPDYDTSHYYQTDPAYDTTDTNVDIADQIDALVAEHSNVDVRVRIVLPWHINRGWYNDCYPLTRRKSDS
jgi:hypothetical protein